MKKHYKILCSLLLMLMPVLLQAQTYCTPAPSSVDGLGITNFTLGTINNTTGAEPTNYGNYSNLVASVVPGTSVPFSITLETGYSYLTRVWVDWDKNGTFSGGEQVYSAWPGDAIPTVISGSFSIPANLLPGSYRLRIGGHDSQRGAFNMGPCFTGPLGTFEDYALGVDYPDSPVVTSFNYGAYCGDSNVITINGTGFEGASLMIGGVAVTPLTTHTDTLITANVAAGIEGTVTVSRPGGSFETTETFSVNLPPVISFSEPSETICSGTSSGTITLYAAENYDTFAWEPSAGVSGDEAAGFTFSPGETTTYALTASNSETGCENYAEIIIVVNPAPSFTIDYVDADPCVNNIVELSPVSDVAQPTGGCVNAPYGSFPGITYSGPCDGTIVGISSVCWAGEYSPVYILSDRTYTFTSTGGSDHITITNEAGSIIYAAGPSPLVFNNSSVSGVIRFYSHTNALCDEENSNRTRYFTCGPYTPPAYTWMPTSGLYTDAAATIPYTGGDAATVYALPEMTTDYTATATNDIGCSRSETVSVIVPTVISLSDSSATICPGEISGVVTITGGVNFDTFVWEPSAGVSGDAAAGFTFSPAETTTYTLTASNSVSGCESAAEITIAVNPAPVFDIDYVAPEPCVDTIVQLNAVTDDVVPVTGGCLNGPYGSFPSNTPLPPNCDGIETTFSNCWAGDYTLLQLYSNTQYTFASDVGSDYITISNQAGTIVYAAGPSPVVYRSTAAEAIRFYSHTDSNCGLSYDPRTRTVVCESYIPDTYTWAPTAGLYTDAAATIPYTGGNATIVYARLAGTSVYTISASSGELGCTVTNTVSLTGGTSWTGAVNTQWEEPGNWSCGQVPYSDINVVIPETANQPVISEFIGGAAYRLVVKEGAILTVAPGNTLDVTGSVEVDATGSIILENNAHLLQRGTSNNNIGSVEVHRNSSKLFRQDYTMWSSPVQGENVRDFSQNTLINRFYTFNPVTNHYVGMFADEAAADDVNFATGQGYLIRMPNGAPQPGYVEGTTPIMFAGTFTGKPNSGDIAVTVTPTADGVSGYNAIGNPYPSLISVPAFFAANAGNTDGTIYLWRRKNQEESATAYSTITADGDFTTSGDPELYPEPVADDPYGVLQTGQGFIVKALTGTINFNNDMRTSNPWFDDSFFRMNNNTPPTNEAHRVWLNLTRGTTHVAQMLVGYKSNATMGIDMGIDAPFINDVETGLNSVIDNKAYVIQGRALPFDEQDVVPLQFKTNVAGNFSITIDHMDGMFLEGQDIFLRDNLLNVTHDIKASGYSFTSDAGVFDTRFEIVYLNNALGTNEPKLDANTIIIYKQERNLVINSGTAVMANVKVFDTRGRLVYERSVINASETMISDLRAEEQMLIVQVTTVENGKVSKKVIF